MISKWLMYNKSFQKDEFPHWPCPHCGSESLVVHDGTFVSDVMESPNNPYFDPENADFCFNVILLCCVPSCQNKVACTGSGYCAKDYIEDGSGDWDLFEYFKPKFFIPNLKIFVPPPETPDEVVNFLNESFSCFFFSQNTALSRLRLALESLLTINGVPNKKSNGDFESLNSRITKFSKTASIDTSEVMGAIKWLGNDGTHSEDEISKEEVLNSYEIFQHLLEVMYPKEIKHIKDRVKSINQNKGLKK